jgi:hypothetical protein
MNLGSIAVCIYSRPEESGEFVRIARRIR